MAVRDSSRAAFGASLGALAKAEEIEVNAFGRLGLLHDGEWQVLIEAARAAQFGLFGDDQNHLSAGDPRQSEFEDAWDRITNDLWNYDDEVEGVAQTLLRLRLLCAEYGLEFRCPNDDVRQFEQLYAHERGWKKTKT